MSILAAILNGAVAAVTGAAFMTAYQEAFVRSRGSSAVAESLKEPRTWAEAPAPAQLAKKVSEGVLGKRVTKRQAPLITNVGPGATGRRWEPGTGSPPHGSAAVFDALD